MTYDRLVCANCAAPVSEGRCHVCRAVRQQMLEEQGQSPLAGLNPAMLIGLMVVLLAALALLAHQTS
ncbi:hypothetical protein [Streptomyces sp. HNA39]|uniref:hypothetical protein n=1 Tax=Streptomyces sp. HNA39 TaxID=2850561 RepID=UPI00200F2293|nr:hypothetical protein [Streptomyces sp. HNA39]UQA34275.1 hypothetical protein KRR37_11260 [Streptomyces sp. HNA39]